MKRIVAVAACGLSLAGCSSLPSWMQLDASRVGGSTTMQFESEPSGAEAKTSTGQSCRTPCSLAVGASEFTVSFTLPGYQPQTVPVRVVASQDPRDTNPEGEAAAARLVPNPVFVELLPATAAPPAARRRTAPPPKPKTAAPKPPPAAAAPAPPPPPAPAPASPWPPAPTR